MGLLENRIAIITGGGRGIGKEIANQELPEKCQEIFFLSRIENKKNSEIAQILGLSKRTVENQLYRALKIIKKILKEKI